MTLEELENDERTQASEKIYDKIKTGVLMGHKVPRGGGTTSLAIASYLRGEKCVIFTTTNKIAEETVKANIVKICNNLGVKPPVIALIPANKKCIIIQKELEDIVKQISEKKKDEDKEEELKELKYKLRTLTSLELLPKGGEDCYGCKHFDECPCMEVLRVRADIIVLTYAKAATIRRALERASGFKKLAIAPEMEYRLLTCRNFLFDESHSLEDSKQNAISDEIKKSLNNGKYRPLLEYDYTEIENTLISLHHILNDSEIKKVIKQSKRAAASKDYYNQHNRVTVSRPSGLADNLDGYRKKDLIIIPKLINEVHDIVSSGDAYKFDVSASELNHIMRAATIINANGFAITTEKQSEKLRTLIFDIFDGEKYYLSKLLRKIQDETPNYRILFTTATFGSYDYKKLLKRGTEIKDINFGAGGDPLNTTAKMRIYNYDLNLGSNSHWKNSISNKMPEILQILIWCLDEYGSDNCFFCTMSKECKKQIEETLAKAGYNCPVHYYRSDKTIGVECEARVGVMIGAAHIPMNSKDAFYKNRTEALRRVREDMYINTVQAMNRVKDPDGKVPSVIISIMAESDLKDMLWHTGEGNEKTGKTNLKVPKTFRLYTEDGKINFSSIKKHMSSGQKTLQTVDDTESEMDINYLQYRKTELEKTEKNLPFLSCSEHTEKTDFSNRDGSSLQNGFRQLLYYIYVLSTQFQNPVMKISITPLHKIYNYILI